MLKKTKGIVINYIKYGDSSIIARIFTRELGYKTYMVNGVRSAKSKNKMALYQPLTLLDMVVYEREHASINRVSEARLSLAFQRIPFDFYRSGIAMFMGEVLGKIIYDGYQNDALFDFLFDSIRRLDSDRYQRASFLLIFLNQTSRYLGFQPDGATGFFSQLPQDRASNELRLKTRHLDELMEKGFEYQGNIPANIRRSLMDDWLLFYKLHVENFGDIKSIQVLRNLF